MGCGQRKSVRLTDREPIDSLAFVAYQHPLVLVHGYGVRGFFWSALRTQLVDRFDCIHTPDFDFATVDQGEDAVVELCRQVRTECTAPIVLIGHSLGGVISSLAVKRLSTDVVSHLVVIASPFGTRVGRAFGPLTRLRFALGLIGRAEMRARFFGPDVPTELQTQVFARAAEESDELKALGRQKRWFHTDAFPQPLAQRVLTIASAADRIVHHSETAAFSHALGGDYHCFAKGDRIGHDDFGVYPPVAERTAAAVRRFLAATATGPGGV